MSEAPTPLAGEIAALVRHTGPIGLDRYMALCLGHPVHGYYRTRDPLGARGDFTTAPEISQMFGELIGLWAVAAWHAMGQPPGTRLIELGPGRGTLMADALRAVARAAPEAAFAVDLVETSPVLRTAQERRLGAGPSWHQSTEEIPVGPSIVIANEFFDALPVRQFVRTARGWCERLVGLGPDDGLAFGLAPEPSASLQAQAPEGAVLTVPGPALAIVRDLACRFAGCGGVLLALDYGHTEPGFGDTLQAVADHAIADPLARPGETDLTAHVDFAGLAVAARSEGAVVAGPVDQGTFLRALGLEARAARLKAGARPDQASEIDAAVARLTDMDRRGMGSLFKVMAVSSPSLGPLPGF